MTPQCRDEVRCAGAAIGLVGAVERDILFAARTIFQCDRCIEAVAEGHRIGDLIQLAIGIAFDLRVEGISGEEVEVRAVVTRQQAAPLDIGLVQRGRSRGVCQRDVGFDKGTQRAEFGRGTCIEVEIPARTPLVTVGVPVTPGVFGLAEVADAEFGPDTTTYAQAGFGAGNVIEARTVGVTDPDIVDRFRSHWQVGRKSRTCGREKTGNCPENNITSHLILR